MSKLIMDPQALEGEAENAVGRLAHLSKSVVTLSEHVGAMLVVAEVILISAAVFCRYVISSPLIWSDDLAEILIIWQAMLGAVVALHKGRHLNLSICIRHLPNRWSGFVDTLRVLLVVFVCAPLAYFSFQHAMAAADLVTPALGVSRSWRSLALPVGLLLMTLLALASLVGGRRSKAGIVSCACAIAAVTAGIYLLRDQFAALGSMNLPIFFLGLGGLAMLLALPIAFCFAIGAMSYVFGATHLPMEIVTSRMEVGMAHVLLLSVPLFIALGSMLNITGLARRLVEFLVACLGHVKAGLSYVLVGGMVLVSGISGSKAADMAAIAPVLLPEMRKHGAKEGEMVALLVAASVVSETIPPSLILIMTGAVTGVSIGALFTAGWAPALALAALLCLLVRIRASKAATAARVDRKTVIGLTVRALPVLVLPVIIRGAVSEGIATATEVATVGIGYVLAMTLVLERRIDWGRLYEALKDASTLTGTIFLILATANAMAWCFVQTGVASILTGLAGSIPGGALGFLFISIIVFVLVGSVLEGIPAILLLGPLLFPVAKSLQISEVHYAIVAVMAMGLGLFIPPFGVGFYTACAIGRVNPVDVVKPLWPYIGVIFVGMVAIAFLPLLTNGFLR